MSSTPPLYIFDLQLNRAERLATVLSFIGEAQQVLTAENVLDKLQQQPEAVVLLGACVSSTRRNIALIRATSSRGLKGFAR